VFGRNSRSTEETVEPTSSKESTSGKGRPTPKRRDAEKGRRRAANAPRDRKEAYRRSRERQRSDRQRAAAGLRAGDERHFPARDRGPVRRYARDMVDSRRSVAEFFLPLAVLILVLTLIKNPTVQLVGSTLWVVLVVLIIVDSIVLVFRLRRGLDRTLPDESHRGAVTYALMRSVQIRRMRIPPPRVKGSRRR
jgi:Flp pilus assembly protein TadB